ncbi:MAG: winged helix-turn-helix domain-containing protein [Candidatus Micrarchaeia archaeon]|jgi:predicted nucleotidyltransferase
MIFRHFYERALGSKVKIRLLRRLLNEDLSASERELAGMIGVSHTAVSKAMKEFYELHLVSPVHVGGAVLWKTNRGSQAYRVLAPLFGREPREALVELLADKMGKFREVGKAVVFGALADGREERDSAIELLVVLRPSARYEGALKESLDRAFFDLDRECRLLFGNGLAAHLASEEELQGRYKDAVAKGIAVVG